MHRTVRRPAHRGFSLLELLIAIAILLAIGATAVVYLLPRKEQADIDLTRANIDKFKQALELFKYDFNRFPTEDEGIAVLWNKELVEDEEEMGNWKFYLKEPLPTDTWKNEWIYIYPSDDLPGMYEIASWGPDGEEDTEDDISSLDSYRNEDGDIDEAFESAFEDPMETG